MRIAFDLDNTLIPCGFAFPTETSKVSKIGSLLGFEPLRKDTSIIFSHLKKKGCEVWIYTTSYRSHCYIRCLFLIQGIWIDGVVNQKDHDQTMRKFNFHSSKYPPAFRIDILIDDSAGVLQEGEKFSFKVLQIKPENERWAEDVIQHCIS